MSEKLTVVITKPQISDYLQLCYDAIKPIFDNVDYWIDNYISEEVSKFSGILKESPGQELIFPYNHHYVKPENFEGIVATHMDSHGHRVFDLLNEIKSKYVIILDSDFFCNDAKFWEKAILLLQEKLMVSVSNTEFKYTKSLTDLPFIHFRGFRYEDFPTTPFLGFRREEILEFAPDRKAWGHFGDVFRIKDPIFDNMKYISFSLHRNDKVGYVDVWGPLNKREFSFFHFWDSRNKIEDDLKIIDNKDFDEIYRIMHLSYVICKVILKYMLNKFENHKAFRLVSRMDEIKKWILKEWKTKGKMPYTLTNPYSVVYDLFKNLPSHINKNEHFYRLGEMRTIFDKYRISPELEKEL